MLAAVLFGTMVGLLAVGVPVVFATGAAALITIIFFLPTMPPVIVPMGMFNGMDSFPMMAIPFFILAGEFMNRGGISIQLINFSKTLVGHIPGALGHTNVVSNAMMSAISGSALAQIAALGRVLIPAMEKEGYDKPFATSLTISASLLGPIIPPSITMVIFAVTAGESVGALFLAGVVPGLIVSFAMMALVYHRSRKYNYGTVVPFSTMRVLRELKVSSPSLLMPVLILGGIFGGVMTPTEAAAVSALYAFVLGFFFYRELTLKDTWDILLRTGMMTAFIMLIVGAARVFSDVMVSEAVPQAIASAMLGLSSDPYVLLLLINLMLLVVGTFMDTTAAIIILVPVLMPVVEQIGMDPLLFGVVMCINLVIGMATPPIGVALFMGAEVGGVKVESLMKTLLPLLAIHVVVLLLVTYVPPVALWLPRVLGY